MTQELNTPNTPPKLIDIDAVDAKALLGIEESGPTISSGPANGLRPRLSNDDQHLLAGIGQPDDVNRFKF